MAKPKGSPARAAGLFLLAAAVGAAGGLLGFLFQSLLEAWQLLRVVEGDSLLEAAERLTPWQRVVVPALGGLLAAACLFGLRHTAAPFGIGDVMDLVITRKGGIRLRHALQQILSSAASIATGSSIGRESANSQLGATAASSFARLFRCSSRDRSVLLGCGVAAGMAVSYNAPIAGALFVMEVVLGNFAMDVFAPIVVSAVIATLVNRALRPEIASHALYEVETVSQLSMMDATLVCCAVLLGCICAVGALGFRVMLAQGRRAFRRLAWSPWLALPVGGALVGAIGIWRPEVWGNGQAVVTDIISLRGDTAVGMLLLIMVLKSLATSISIGSGALGGVFTPTLVVGAALGSCYASGILLLLPDHWLQLSSPALHTGFALVGMAGLVAATTHAPITAVLLVFEFTRNYELVLPVMICSILASLMARMLQPDSIFMAKLREKGHTVVGGIEALAMQTNYVRDVMRADAQSLIYTATFREVMALVAGERRDTIYVVDETESLAGRIHIHDIKTYINDPTLASIVIAGDLTRPAPAVHPEQTLAQVFELFDDPDLDELPVVVGPGDDRLVGRLTRRDIIALLTDQVLGQRNLRARLRVEDAAEDTYVQLPPQTELARVAVHPELRGQTCLGQPVLERHGLLPLVVIEVDEHGVERRFLPDGELRLTDRMALVVLGPRHGVQNYTEEVRT